MCWSQPYRASARGIAAGAHGRVLVVSDDGTERGAAATRNAAAFLREVLGQDVVVYAPLLPQSGLAGKHAVIPIQSALVSGMASVYGDDWESETTPVAVPQHCRSGVVRAAPASHFRDPSSIVPLGIDFAVTITSAAAPALLSSLFPDACPLVLGAEVSDAAPTCEEARMRAWLENAMTCAVEGSVDLLARHRARVKVFRPERGERQVRPCTHTAQALPVHPHLATAPRLAKADGDALWVSHLPGPGRLHERPRVPMLRRAALNEVIVHRAPGPSSTYCRISVDDQLLTTVVGDGLVLCTPTGSGGYARSLGAAAVDPSIAGMQVCPVNPYSLAFRPMLLPGASKISVEFESARAHRPLTFLVDGTLHPLDVADTVEVSCAPAMFSIVPRGKTPSPAL